MVCLSDKISKPPDGKLGLNFLTLLQLIVAAPATPDQRRKTPRGWSMPHP